MTSRRRAPATDFGSTNAGANLRDKSATSCATSGAELQQRITGLSSQKLCDELGSIKFASTKFACITHISDTSHRTADVITHRMESDTYAGGINHHVGGFV